MKIATKYSIGEEVSFVLSEGMVAVITGIIINSEDCIAYKCTFFNGDIPAEGVFFEYELCKAKKRHLGFVKK